MIRALLILFFPAPIFSAEISDHASDVFSTGQPPPWVQPVDYDLSPATVKPSQVNVQYLLIDTQRNWEEKTVFKQTAIKPLTQACVEEVSHLKLVFNPAFTLYLRPCNPGVSQRNVA